MDWRDYYTGPPSQADVEDYWRGVITDVGGAKGIEWLTTYDQLQRERDKLERLATNQLAAQYTGRTDTGAWKHPDIINLLSQTNYPGGPGFDTALKRFASDVRSGGLDRARDWQWQRNEQFPTGLTPEDIAEQRLLAQIQNDYAAMAGRGPSAPGVGHLTESLQSARQNALRYVWEDEWAKRLSTPDYDPRYAQRTTSFAPNQFSPAANVYVDPFMQQGPRGGLREQVRTPGPPEEVNPLLGAPYTHRGTEQLAGRTIQPSPMPQMPMGMDQKAMTKFFGERDKEQETERKARQAEIEKSILAAHKKKQAELDKIEKNWHEVQYKFRQREKYARDEKGNMLEADKARYYKDLAEWAAHYQPAEYKAFLELSGGDPDVAQVEFASFLRAKQDPVYRKVLADKKKAQEEAPMRLKERVERQEARHREILERLPGAFRQMKEAYGPRKSREEASEERRATSKRITPPNIPQIPGIYNVTDYLNTLEMPQREKRKPGVAITPKSQRWLFDYTGPKYPRGQELWPSNAANPIIEAMSRKGPPINQWRFPNSPNQWPKLGLRELLELMNEEGPPIQDWKFW